MADNNTLTRRGERGADFQIDEIDLRRRKVEQALPSHFVKEYPDFVEFLVSYYDFLESDQGLDRMVERLRDVRNADIAQGDYVERMMCEYGEGFPDLGTLTDANALKLFHMWFKSKGNQEAIEAYFRLFLNTEAEVVYPKDNMLRVSDGNWDNDAQRYEDQQGHISETTMVIQDSTFYQVYSYLVRSGVSIADWGPQFKELAHPAGWNLFGEVRIEGLAQFEQYRAVTRSGARSPMIVPGFQTRDANLLILTAAIYFVVGNTDVSPIDHRMRTFPQFIRKYWKVVVADGDDAYSLESVNKNILVSTHTIGELKDIQINEINDPGINRTFKAPNQKPARILTSNLISNGEFTTDLTGWSSSLLSNGTAVVASGVCTITETTDGGGTPRIYQSIPCVVGETYVAYADCYGSANSTASLSVNTSASGTSIASGNVFGTGVTGTSGSSERVAVTFTATQTTHNVIAYISDTVGSGQTATFERIYVKKISLP